MKKYWPLFCLILISFLASLAIENGDLFGWMHYFMGFFLCQFAMLKLFDVNQFKEGFSKYDLLAKKIPAYGLFYPFVELGLGLGYLSFFEPVFIYWATIVVLGLGALGVFKALKEGLDVRCACMGTVLNVPISTVTLTEDLAMVVMAALLLFM